MSASQDTPQEPRADTPDADETAADVSAGVTGAAETVFDDTASLEGVRRLLNGLRMRSARSPVQTRHNSLSMPEGVDLLVKPPSRREMLAQAQKIVLKEKRQKRNKKQYQDANSGADTGDESSEDINELTDSDTTNTTRVRVRRKVRRKHHDDIVPEREVINASSRHKDRMDNRRSSVTREGDVPAEPTKIRPRRPSRLRHSVELSCDMLQTLQESFRESVERSFWSVVQDKPLWDADNNIIEVIPMAGTIKHKFDRAAYTFLRVDGHVVLRIDRDDVATFHVPYPSMVQKIILEQMIEHIGWHWARLTLVDGSIAEATRDKKVNASSGANRRVLKENDRILQLIDASTGEWCDLSKPVRIRLPGAVAQQRHFWRKQNRRRARENRRLLNSHVTRRGFKSLGISLRRIAIRKKVIHELLEEPAIPQHRVDLRSMLFHEAAADSAAFEEECLFDETNEREDREEKKSFKPPILQRNRSSFF